MASQPKNLQELFPPPKSKILAWKKLSEFHRPLETNLHTSLSLVPPHWEKTLLTKSNIYKAAKLLAYLQTKANILSFALHTIQYLLQSSSINGDDQRRVVDEMVQKMTNSVQQYHDSATFSSLDKPSLSPLREMENGSNLSMDLRPPVEKKQHSQQKELEQKNQTINDYIRQFKDVCTQMEVKVIQLLEIGASETEKTQTFVEQVAEHCANHLMELHK